MDKQTIFVTPNGEIQKEKLNSEPHYFEILATPEEVKNLELLVKKSKNFHKDEVLNLVSTNIYREYKVEQDRGESNQAIYDLYAEIYELGTIKTKKEIDSLGIFQKS